MAGGSVDSWCEVAASGLRGPGEGLLVYGTSMFLVEVAQPGPLRLRGCGAPSGFTPGSLEHRRRRRLRRSAHGLAARSDRRRGLRPALYAEAAAAGPAPAASLALPYFAGERTPLFDPDLRGAVVGLTAAHGRGHLFRALMEAAAFAVRQNLETMREAGATIARPAQQRRRGGRRALAADRQRRHRAGAGRAREGRRARPSAPPCSRRWPPAPRRCETRWPQPAVRVEPDPGAAPLYDELYGWFRELATPPVPLPTRLRSGSGTARVTRCRRWRRGTKAMSAGNEGTGPS